MQNEIREIENILRSVTTEYKAEARLIIEAVSGQSLADILREGHLKNFQNAVKIAKKRVKTRMPVQYLLNFAYFAGEKFYVNEDVLIPREETQFLVETALNVIKSGDEILEIGTGSGCISCILAKSVAVSDFHILATDVSTSALRVALKNAETHALPNQIVFRKSDIFNNIKEKFNVIISNPPYVGKNFKIERELEFEPQIALFADDNGFYFYKKIISEARCHLKKNGFLLFECGMGQADEIVKMLEDEGFFDIRIIFDLANIGRVVCAHV